MRRLPTRWGASLFGVGAVLLMNGAVPSVAGIGNSDLVSRDLPPPAPVASGPLFQSLPADRTGIDLTYHFPTNAPFGLLQDQGCAAGVCIGDFNADGRPDLFFTHYDRGNRLYQNLGNWRFTNVTERAGVAASGRWCSGATFVDIDNDGDLDLYVCVFNAPNLLFINQGDGTFLEQAERFGLNFSGASVMMAFADYDRDGDLDAYLVTHRLNVGPDQRLPSNSQAAFRRSIIRRTGPAQVEVNPAYRELFDTISKGPGRTELIIAGQQDYLYRNDGGSRFSIVNSAAGIQGNDIGLAAMWWDYNDDGFPDIYVSNDYKGPDRLYRNNRDGTFTDVARQTLPHTPWSSMGTDIADVDNDGRLDLMATEMTGSTHFRRMSINGDLPKERWFLTASQPPQYQRNALYLGTGTEHVLEAAFLTGLDGTDWTWSPKFGDFDNDGFIDLFIANGMSRDFIHADLMGSMADRGGRKWLEEAVLREENLAFRNRGDLRFENVGKRWGLSHVSASFGAAVGDLDNDGNLDLVVSNFDGPVSVYRNQGSPNHRLLLRLKGTRSNSWGIGAKVQLITADGLQSRMLGLCSGIMSANEPLVHFGLGRCQTVNELRIQWPSGRRQTLFKLAADRLYTVVEAAESTLHAVAQEGRPWFKPLPQAAPARHLERVYDDFALQPSLPWKLSQLGPGLAMGDADGDGDEDFYLGGAAGAPGVLGLNDGVGQFQPVTFPCFKEDQAAEDMGALFFDADGDGDLDLYVVSGGVECGPGDAVLRDRLYLNQGAGQFIRAPVGVLPDLRDSGSCVVAADFDRDGDLDLFVGSRYVPGAYPKASPSRLLRNEGGRFADVTDSVGAGLKDAGLVTGALWSNANGDGWPDLLVTREWGTVGVFLNRQGRLAESTDECGLGLRRGWWNGIAGCDLDNDGDIDYVVTNLGLNTPYRAEPDRPVLGFQVPSLGGSHLVEAYFEGNTLYPMRRREWFLQWWPALVEKFPTYRSFAAAPLTNILTPESLRAAPPLSVNTLESVLLLNDGQARFSLTALPRRAQIAPAFGLIASELNGDGQPDLGLAQNFFSPQPEVGHLDGGLSQVLAGETNGAFKILGPQESGLVVPGDAKSLALGDFNRDGRPDLLVGRNDAELLVFTNSTGSSNRFLRVQLRGGAGNPNGIGSLVRVKLSDGSQLAAEVYAGSGYLSQSSSTLFIGLGTSNRVDQILVRWPDGRLTDARPPPAGELVVIRREEP